LAQLKTAIQQLEQCVDRLLPPFVLAADGGLPLALNHVFSQYEGDISPTQTGTIGPAPVQIDLKLPRDWMEQSPAPSAARTSIDQTASQANLGSLLLLGLAEQLTSCWLQTDPAIAQVGAARLSAQLLRRKQRAQFTLSLSPPIALAALPSQDANQLRRAFQLLSGGRCQVERSDDVEAWNFIW